MDEVTVGIDIGTTSVKAVAVGADGEVIARARVPHELRFPAADRMEHDAARAWRQGPRRALAALHQPAVSGVAVAAMVPSLTAVTPRGVPQSPGLLYGDVRGRRYFEDGPAGASGEALGFLDWTASQFPDAGGYWTAQAVANHALAGEAVMDSASAASTYPLFNGVEWDPERIAGFGVDARRLPRVAGLGEAVGKVGDAVLASGLVDALGEQVVAGADDAGDVLVLLGSTLITWAVVAEWRPVEGLWCIPHSAPGKFLVGGASNAGGIFVNWALRSLAADLRDERVDPASVPVWAPYPRGERVPLHDPARRAGLHDLDVTHGPATMRRAAYEASAFVARHTLDVAGVAPRRIVATGGGTRVGEWVRALADATGLPVDVAAVPEGGALGAAWVARVAAGLESDVLGAGSWARTSHRVEPDPAWAPRVQQRYARFRELAAA